MVDDGMVGCLARLLPVAAREKELLQNVTTALALTSLHPEVKAEMIKEGVVRALILALKEQQVDDEKTQHAAASVFASLSFSPRSLHL